MITENDFHDDLRVGRRKSGWQTIMGHDSEQGEE